MQQVKEEPKFRYIPFLGVMRVHPLVQAMMELDQQYIWKGFAFAWGWWEVYFMVWAKERPNEE